MASCSAIGILQSRSYKQRVDGIRSFIDAFQIAKAEIVFKNTPVSVDRLDRIGADVTIRIGGEEYNCYLGDCEMYAVEIGGGGRAMDGSIWRGEITHKRKFTFIEC